MVLPRQVSEGHKSPSPPPQVPWHLPSGGGLEKMPRDSSIMAWGGEAQSAAEIQAPGEQPPGQEVLQDSQNLWPFLILQSLA